MHAGDILHRAVTCRVQFSPSLHSRRGSCHGLFFREVEPEDTTVPSPASWIRDPKRASFRALFKSLEASGPTAAEARLRASTSDRSSFKYGIFHPLRGSAHGSMSAMGRCAWTLRQGKDCLRLSWYDTDRMLGPASQFTRRVVAPCPTSGMGLRGVHGTFRGGPMEGDEEHPMPWCGSQPSPALSPPIRSLGRSKTAWEPMPDWPCFKLTYSPTWFGPTGWTCIRSVSRLHPELPRAATLSGPERDTGQARGAFRSGSLELPHREGVGAKGQAQLKPASPHAGYGLSGATTRRLRS